MENSPKPEFRAIIFDILTYNCINPSESETKIRESYDNFLLRMIRPEVVLEYTQVSLESLHSKYTHQSLRLLVLDEIFGSLKEIFELEFEKIIPERIHADWDAKLEKISCKCASKIFGN